MNAVGALVYLFFFLSGATALAYQIVWTRQLTLVAGASTPAVSAVLAVFMGGLGLGAWLFGSIADRSRHILRWYAALEIGIGLFALVQPQLLSWTGSLYLSLLPDAAPASLHVSSLRLALAVLLLLVPTTLMGGTLPVLLRFVARSEERIGWSLGTLYATNIAGAVAGSACTGFVLIRFVGIQHSVTAAVLVNLTIGLAALALARHATPGALPPDEATAPLHTPSTLGYRLRRLLWSVVFLSGFLTMGYEVAWTRVLVFAFGSTIYAFTLILVVFLLGLALGSGVFAVMDRRWPGLPVLAACHFLAATTALLVIPLAAGVPDWILGLSRTWGHTGETQLLGMLLGGAAVMLLPATLMGVVFPLSSRLLIEDLATSGRTLGRAYWVNTAGAIFGSLLTGFVLLPTLSLKGCLLALASVQLGVAAVLFPRLSVGTRAVTALATGGCAVVGLVLVTFLRLLPGVVPFDRLDYMQDAQPPTVIAHRDDVTATVAVLDLGTGERVLRINGFEAAAESRITGAGYMPMMSHLPLVLHGQGRRVLVICFGTGSTAGAVLLHPEARVDAVDLNRSVLEFAPLFRRTNNGVGQDPRARLVLDDGRHYLLRTDETYDVITSEPMPPMHAGVVNLYSREYYALARQRLNPGGLLVQWLPFHLVTYDQARSILRTVQDVCPETTLWLHSKTGLIVARAGGPLVFDQPSITRSFEVPALAEALARLAVPSIESLSQLFALGPREVRDLAGDSPVITDDRPSLEFHPPRNRFTPMVDRDGIYTPDEMRMLLEVFKPRSEDGFAARGVAAAEVERMALARRARNALISGNLLLSANRPVQAAQVFENGLALASGPAERARFRQGLATAAWERGDWATTVIEAERCLGDDPTNGPAQDLRNAARTQLNVGSGGTRRPGSKTPPA